jgi:hypothetical protein
MHANPSSNESMEAPTANERDEKGRFRKGNAGGPGNPFTRRMASLRKAALEAVSEEEIREMIEVLKQKGREGDVAAIKLLLSYTVGKPSTGVDPDLLDKHELETMVSNQLESMQSVMQVVQGMPLEILLTILRTVLPVLHKEKIAMAAKELAGGEEKEVAEQATSATEEAVEAEAPAAEVPAVAKQDAVGQAGAMQDTVLRQMQEWIDAVAKPMGSGTERGGVIEAAGPIGNGCNGKRKTAGAT